MSDWNEMDTCPTEGRDQILLKTPHSPNGSLAWSNTWWTCGFSVECKPSAWRYAAGYPKQPGPDNVYGSHEG